MERKKVLIIGGVACGAKTAARLARLAPEFDITVLERGEHLSFAGCGFPYFVGDVVKEYKDLVCTPLGIIRDANFFRTVKNVTVHTGCLATRIDRENRCVTASDASTTCQTMTAAISIGEPSSSLTFSLLLSKLRTRIDTLRLP